MTPPTELVITRKHQPEKQVYEECAALLRLHGFAVYRLSQTRATKQTPGIPDLYAMHHRRGALWMECKTDIGKQSAWQQAFQLHCVDCGIPYVVGGVPELGAWLKTGKISPWPRPKQ